MSEAPRGRGRPRRTAADGGTPTRERILLSARTEFAASGYDRTSVRTIARGAGVDSALVHHYFGSKEELFSAAVAAAAAPMTEGLASTAHVTPDELGLVFTRFFFGIWENPVTRAPLLMVVRSAVSNETAARLLRDFVTGQMLGRFEGLLEAPDRKLRVELAAAQLVGTMLLRHVLQAEPVASADAEDLIRRLSSVVQFHLTGGPGGPGGGADGAGPP